MAIILLQRSLVIDTLSDLSLLMYKSRILLKAELSKTWNFLGYVEGTRKPLEKALEVNLGMQALPFSTLE